MVTPTPTKVEDGPAAVGAEAAQRTMPGRCPPGQPAGMTASTPCPGTYTIDPERSVITVRTRHLFGLAPVRGTFRLGSGEIGSLVVTGRTRPVELAIERARADGRELSVVATTAIDRYAFGVTAMKGLAGRRLSCRLEILAIRRNDDGHRG